ncbi:MAG: hypothetical protein LLF94_08730 [Chlamydiales bacterium]|nr:hypothetical protein [Chlamydiales bacterium]
MTYFANWPMASVTHPICQAEHTLTQEPGKLTVDAFPMDKKMLPLDDEYYWKKLEGRVSAFVVKYNPFIWPFTKSVETTISSRDADEALSHDFNEESVPLLRQDKPTTSPFQLTKEKDQYFFYDSRAHVRSRGFTEEALVTSVCGKPQPHIGIASCNLQNITVDGIPNMVVALRQKGDFRPSLHRSFIIKPFARLLGLDDRDRLVAVGEVKKAGLLDEAKFEVPNEPVITARQVDTTIKTLFGLGIFSAAAVAYDQTPGYFSLGAVGCSLFVLFEAYSSYSQKPN